MPAPFLSLPSSVPMPVLALAAAASLMQGATCLGAQVATIRAGGHRADTAAAVAARIREGAGRQAQGHADAAAAGAVALNHHRSAHSPHRKPKGPLPPYPSEPLPPVKPEHIDQIEVEPLYGVPPPTARGKATTEIVGVQAENVGRAAEQLLYTASIEERVIENAEQEEGAEIDLLNATADARLPVREDAPGSAGDVEDATNQTIMSAHRLQDEVALLNEVATVFRDEQVQLEDSQSSSSPDFLSASLIVGLILVGLVAVAAWLQRSERKSLRSTCT